MNRREFLYAMGILSFLFGSSARPQPAAPSSAASNAGRELRQMMLTTPAEEMGQTPTPDFPRIYGVLMEWPIGDQIATIVSTSTGAASLYTTSTFGIIGGEGHEQVRAAAIAFVRATDRLFDVSASTTEYPYPASGRVRFYLLTFDGVRVVDTDMASIETRMNAYTQYFDLGQSVLTELRLIYERR